MSRKTFRIALVGSFMLSLHATASEIAEVGKPAPAFKLEGTDGKTYELSQFKGKQPIVLAWYPKAKTKGCTAECISMTENSKALKETNAAYFGISCDTVEYNKEFSEMHKMDFTLLCDPSKKVAAAYGVVHEGRPNPERWTFYIDKEGIVRKIDKAVNTKSHGADIVSALKVLKLAK